MVRASRYIYLVAAALFVVGVLVQVYLAGMVVVARQGDWNSHIGLGHILAAPLLFMLISMYLGRLPRSMKLTTWLLFAVYALQADVVIFMQASAPLVSALHPVFALVDFTLGVILLRQAWQVVRTTSAAQGMQPEASPPVNP